MLPKRVHISLRATELLKQIKSKTGVTPNILCRMALVLSLEERHKANPEVTDINGAEFNLPTLLGDASTLYEALLTELHGELNAKTAQLVLAAHIDNGVDRLKRVKSAGDLLSFQIG
ncbi:MAG: DndE family protein [Gammaproteobacteria bacterium]|nr:DndE family protein [Gammaproteobacteria bacterium]